MAAGCAPCVCNRLRTARRVASQFHFTLPTRRVADELGILTAGDKKDLALTNRLWTHPGRVAIYGWHRPGGDPIQPLSTVHGIRYADYSHGVRLVSDTAYIGGKPT